MTTTETAARASKTSLPAAEAQALMGLLEKGSAVEARERATALMADYPRAPLPHKALGAVAARTGSMGQATAHFIAALDRAPSDKESRVNLARAMLESGVDAKGVEALKRVAVESAAQLGPKDLLQEALVLCVACEPEIARERLHQALKHAPGDFELLDYYARILVSNPTAETEPEGVGAVLRILMDPRLENRGAQRVAAITLENDLKRHARTVQNGGTSSLAMWFTPLLIAMLGHGFNTSLILESMLITMRSGLLGRVSNGDILDQENLDLTEALARHSFQCEFLWPETPQEAAQLETLQANIERALGSAAPVSAAELFILGAYRDLAKVDAVREWVAALALQAPESLEPTLRKLVLEPVQEAEFALKMPALTEIDGGVPAPT